MKANISMQQKKESALIVAFRKMAPREQLRLLKQAIAKR
jgi:hypothetical protein